MAVRPSPRRDVREHNLKTFVRQNAERYTLAGQEVEAVAEHDIMAETSLSPAEIATALYRDPDVRIWVDEHPERGRSRFYGT